MKPLFLPLALSALLSSLILAACGGGGGGSGGTSSPAGSMGASSSSSSASSASSASTRLPTLVECLTPKIGVSYQWQDGEESSWLQGKPGTANYKIIRQTFEGMDAIGTYQYYEDTKDSYVSYARVLNGEYQSLGHIFYKTRDANGVISNKTIDTPPLTIPGNLQPGQTLILNTTEKYASFNETSGSFNPATNYALAYEAAFLGYEDVTLGDGTVLKNACKIRLTTLTDEETPKNVGDYSIIWQSPGYDAVKVEAYTPAGVKDFHGLITKVIQAP